VREDAGIVKQLFSIDGGLGEVLQADEEESSVWRLSLAIRSCSGSISASSAITFAV
jgi:hypothetical protein